MDAPDGSVVIPPTIWICCVRDRTLPRAIVPVSVSSLNPDGYRSQLDASDYAAERGGRVVALTLPHTMRVRLSFLSGFVGLS